MAEYHDLVISGTSSVVLSAGDYSWNASVMSGGVLVASQGVCYDTKLLTGGTLEIYNMGIANQTEVCSGAGFTVGSKGAADYTVVSGGGLQTVLALGGTSRCVIHSGGSAVIFGSSYFETVREGGMQSVSSGGVANRTRLQGGTQTIYSGGLSVSAVISESAGMQLIRSGGTASAATLYGGTQSVEALGRTVGTQLYSGGEQLVRGTASATAVYSTGLQKVSSGGSALGSLINYGGLMSVAAGGSAIDGIVYGGGKISVENGGAAAGITVIAGVLNVTSGGLASACSVKASGLLMVDSGGSALAIAVDSGGVIAFDFGAKASWSSGGSGFVSVDNMSLNLVYGSGCQTVSAGFLAANTLVDLASAGIGQDVLSGGTASGTRVLGGGQNVRIGATAANSVISGETGAQYVYGSALGTEVGAGSVQQIFGYASGTTAAAGGLAMVEANGVAVNVRVASNGKLVVACGGSATAEVLSGGRFEHNFQATVSATIGGSSYIADKYESLNWSIGNQTVSSGYRARATVVNSGFCQTVLTGGAASATAVYGELKLNGGLAVNATVCSGGLLTVLSGSAVGATISGGLAALSGGFVSAATIISGGVMSGAGSAYEIAASNGGCFIQTGGNMWLLQVYSGGSACLAGGTMHVAQLYTGGVMDVTGTLAASVRISGGLMRLIFNGRNDDFIVSGSNGSGVAFSYSGANISGAAIVDGVMAVVRDGAVLSGASATGGGKILLESGATGSGLTASSGGSLTVASGGAAADILIASGGRIVLLDGGAAAENITIASNGNISLNIFSGDGNRITGIRDSTTFTESSGVASGLIVKLGDSVAVFSGGVTYGTFVAGSGVESIGCGGSAFSTVIYGFSNGYNPAVYGLQIVSGGYTEDVRNMGYQSVYDGGSAVRTVIISTGIQFIGSGGFAVDAVISGGSQAVLSGGATSGTVISGGSQIVSDGGRAAATTIYNGIQIVSRGGYATGTIVSGGVQLLRNVTVSNTEIYAGGTQTVEDGCASGTDVHSGGTLLVCVGRYNSATADHAVIRSGGALAVNSNCVVSAATMENGSILRYNFGATSIAGVSAGKAIVHNSAWSLNWVYSAGVCNVQSGQIASNATVTDNATMIVSSGGLMLGGMVQNGGLMNCMGSANSAAVNNSGRMLISGRADGIVVGSGGKLSVETCAVASGVSAAAGGVIGWNFGATVSGILANGSAIVTNAMVSYNYILNGGTQTVSSGYTAIATELLNGSQTIYSGGVASGTTGHGSVTVASGGVLRGDVKNCETTVDDGGLIAGVNYEYGSLSLYGTAENIIIDVTGLYVCDGGFGSGLSLRHKREWLWGGADGTVYLGGKLREVTVTNGYYLKVCDGGRIESAAVYGGEYSGVIAVEAGAIVDDVLVGSGGKLAVESNASATGVAVSGGIMAVEIDPTKSTFITGTNEHGVFKLESGVADNFVLNSGSTMTVAAGGLVRNIDVRDGAVLAPVFAAGSDGCEISGVNSYGEFHVSGFVASRFIFSDPERRGIAIRANLYDCIITSGGGIYLTSGSINSGTSVLYGGHLSARGKTANVVVSSGGSLSLIGDFWNIASNYAAGNTATDLRVESGATLWGLENAILCGSGTNIAGGTIHGNESAEFVSGVGRNLVIDESNLSQTIGSGITVSGTLVSYGYLNLIDGGRSVGSVLSKFHGYERVFSGGAASESIINGNQIVYSGGSAVGCVVQSGGYQLLSGGAIIGTTIGSGGTVIASAYSEITSTSLLRGGNLQITWDNTTASYDSSYIQLASNASSGFIGAITGTREFGGQVSNLYLTDSKTWSLGSDGTASGIVIAGNNTILIVQSGATAYGTCLSSSYASPFDHAKLLVAAGGVSIGTVISSYYDGLEVVAGVASGTYAFFGSQTVTSGGTAVGTILDYAGRLLVESGGVASGATINRNARLTLDAGAVIGGTTTIAGYLSVLGSATNNGNLIFRAQPNTAAGSREAITGLDLLSGGSFTVEFDADPSTYTYIFTGAEATDKLNISYKGSAYLLAVGGNMDMGGGKHLALERSSGSLVMNLYGSATVLTGHIASGGYVLDEENIAVKSMVCGAGGSTSGNVRSTVRVSGPTNANIYGGGHNASVGGGISMSFGAEDGCTGLIYGGSFASAATVTGGGYVSLGVSDTVQTDNIKMLKYGNTAWIVGGGAATAGAALKYSGSVSTSISGSHVVRVVGGAQADGAGTTASVGSTSISISRSTVTGNIYGGGYAYNGGTSVVEGNVSISINAYTSGESATITGNIYGGGANPRHYAGGGSSIVNGNVTVSFSGSGDYLNFSGVVSGDGQIAGTVLGTKKLQFSGFTGEFFGVAQDFDILSIGPNSSIKFDRTMSMEELSLDASYIKANTGIALVDFAEGFEFSGDNTAVDLKFDISRTNYGTYEIIRGSDLSVFDDSTFNLKNSNGSSYQMAIGDSMAYQSGFLSLEEDEACIKLVYFKA